MHKVTIETLLFIIEKYFKQSECKLQNNVDDMEEIGWINLVYRYSRVLCGSENEKDVYELIRSDFQDMVLSEETQSAKV